MRNPLPVGLAVTSRFWSALIALLLLTYAFFRDNSVNYSDSEGHAWVRLLELPKQLRFVEFATVVGLVALLVLVRASSLAAISKFLLTGSYLFAVLTLMSYIRRPFVGPADFIRLVYMYILPLLVFIIGREMSWTAVRLSRMTAFVLIWVLISAAVSWIQYLLFGFEPGDDIMGLAQDAHSNVALLVTAMLILLAQGLFYGKRLRIVVAAALGVTAVLPSALKILFLVPFFVLHLLWYYARRTRRIRWTTFVRRSVVAAAVVVVFVFVTFSGFRRIDFRSAERIDEIRSRIVSSPQTFGPAAAHVQALRDLISHPGAFLLGVGPFGYSNPISMGQTREGGPLDRLTRSELVADPSRETGEDARVTLTTGLAEEFGVPAALLLGLLYLAVLVSMHRSTRSADIIVAASAAAMAPAVALLIGLAVLSQFGSVTTLAFSWSVMLIAGATARVRQTWPVIPTKRVES